VNYGNIAKKIAFDRGFMNPVTAEDGLTYGEAREFAPGKLDKANEAFDKLREQTERRWKLVEPEKKKKPVKKTAKKR